MPRKKKTAVTRQRDRRNTKKPNTTKKHGNRPGKKKEQSRTPKAKAHRPKKRTAEQRSQASRLGWETRRARAHVKRTVRKQKARRTLPPPGENVRWQRWVYEHRVNVTATLLYDEPEALTGKAGEKRVREDAERLLYLVYQRHPKARLWSGTILYKRSTDGKKWEKGISPKYLSWQRGFNEALNLFISQAGGFYQDLTNPDRLQHAYKVKIVGLAARAMLKKTKTAHEEGNQPTIPGITSLSRSERMKRQMGLL
jgi:hypothetical protein